MSEQKKEDKIEKSERVMRLFDVYGGALTKERREITDLYFSFDLSLAEIAEEKGVSRQSVSDCLKKSRLQLESLEDKLKIVSLLEENEKKERRVALLLDGLKEKHPDWKDEIEEIQKLLNCD